MNILAKKTLRHLRGYRAYYFSYAVFLACLFTSPYVYSFFDFHPCEAYEHYERDRTSWEREHGTETAFMSYPVWIELDQQRDKDLWREIGDDFALCFDPWFEPKPYEHDFGREE